MAKRDQKEIKLHDLKPMSGHWYRQKLHIQPQPGFPWQNKFSRLEELKAYFNEDKLTCLLCGRRFSQLGNHISQGHGFPKDQYKEQFGIPWTYGLGGKIFRDILSSQIKERQASGIIPLRPTNDHIMRMINASKTSRPIVEAYKNDSRRKVLELHGRIETWSSEDYNEFLRRIKSGRTPSEVGRDSDMPCYKTFGKHLKTDPSFKKRFDYIWKKLPYSVHVRASKLGEKFQQEIVSMRRQRLTLAAIAEKLGVKTASVRGTWHKLKKQGKLKPKDLALEQKRRHSTDQKG